jgi:hypothetical protein
MSGKQTTTVSISPWSEAARSSCNVNVPAMSDFYFEQLKRDPRGFKPARALL